MVTCLAAGTYSDSAMFIQRENVWATTRSTGPQGSIKMSWAKGPSLVHLWIKSIERNFIGRLLTGWNRDNNDEQYSLRIALVRAPCQFANDHCPLSLAAESNTRLTAESPASCKIGKAENEDTVEQDKCYTLVRLQFRMKWKAFLWLCIIKYQFCSPRLPASKAGFRTFSRTATLHSNLYAWNRQICHKNMRIFTKRLRIFEPLSPPV